MPAAANKTSERRFFRSDDPLTSLSRLFDAARRRGQLDALVLADETGLMVAGAGVFQVCEELAAKAATHSDSDGGAGPTSRVSVRRIRVEGISALLCSLGDAPGSLAEFDRAVAGCTRILGREPASRYAR